MDQLEIFPHNFKHFLATCILFAQKMCACIQLQKFSLFSLPNKISLDSNIFSSTFLCLNYVKSQITIFPPESLQIFLQKSFNWKQVKIMAAWRFSNWPNLPGEKLKERFMKEFSFWWRLAHSEISLYHNFFSKNFGIRHFILVLFNFYIHFIGVHSIR